MNELSTLQRLLTAFDFECDKYSGRGMFGKSCLSTSVEAASSNDALLEVVISVMKAISAFKEGNSFCDPISSSEESDIIDVLKSTKVDNLGQGYVVYFPTVQYCDVSAESETEE